MIDAPYEIRILGLTYEDPESLLAHPKNPKIHPKAQSDALDAAMTEVGILAPVLINDVTQHCLDGHERIGLWIARGMPKVPVLHVNVPEEKEGLVLATFDPIGALAVTDQTVMDELIAASHAEDSRLVQFLASRKTFDPAAEWQGMPEFEQPDSMPYRTISVHFADENAISAFAELTAQHLTADTKSIWYPEQKPQRRIGEHYVSDEPTVPDLHHL